MSETFRYSEPVPPTGGLQAQGLANLLGAPPMGPISLVIREAAQNIWDARRKDSSQVQLRMLVRVRTLGDEYGRALRDLLGPRQGSVAEPPVGDRLTSRLNRGGPLPVLEICDFGTEGLSGGVDPTAEDSRFVKFFFDIGSTHFDGTTGGTYGFGRSSLYLAGEARTIVTDSLTMDGERRLMACRLGESFVGTAPDGSRKRYTGRHFWGARESDGSGVRPLVGEAARAWSERLGMPLRNGEADSGTSILIPWPETSGVELGHLLPQIIYRNLWPKLVADGDGLAPMVIDVEVDGRFDRLSIDKAPPIFSGFAFALSEARTRSAPARAVGSLSPARVGGHVSVTRLGPLPALPEPVGDDDPYESFRDGVRHVALMRASELVVSYRRVDTDSSAGTWAGVLLASDDRDVSRIFAASEPPAHDDWVPSKLKGQEATLVRKTLERMPEAVRSLLGLVGGSATEGVAAPPLSLAADEFAERFLAGDGSAASEVSPPEPGSRGASSPGRLGVPEFVGLQLLDGQPVAEFVVDWPGQGEATVEGKASVAMSGGTVSEHPEGIPEPQVLGWALPDGQFFPGGRCTLSGKGRYVSRVMIPGSYAVFLEVSEVPGP